MSNIYVCCDGTWQTPDDEEDGIPTPSNVVKIANAIASHDQDGKPQRKYYHSGVGAEGGLLTKAIGGGMGVGISGNIKSAYKWLAESYAPGDDIYLFGFSRGAYTVRSLAGMIGACGLLDLTGDDLVEAGKWQRVQDVFENYRRKPSERRQFPGFAFHNCETGGNPVKKTPIHFLGVWDTVGALGIPDHMGLLNLLDDPENHEFHDTELSEIVRHARHAVAMDEMRAAFTPTLWTDHDPQTDMKQCYFAGVHGDVGGGYAQTGLSDTALEWMIEEAEHCGLIFRDSAKAQLRPDPRGVQHDSLTKFFKVLEVRPRNVPCLTDGEAAEIFHPSVRERHQRPPITSPNYWPSVSLEVGQSEPCDIFARELWNPTYIYLRQGETYELTAKGEWLDSSIKCGPGGTNDGDFHIAEIAQIVASGVGQLERLFRHVSGNQQADFWFTKRVEKSPWFALMGIIANGAGTGRDGSPLAHETIEIGESKTVNPKADGYLYCFANDAWRTYDNNRGSVKLTVKRVS